MIKEFQRLIDIVGISSIPKGERSNVIWLSQGSLNTTQWLTRKKQMAELKTLSMRISVEQNTPDEA